MTKYVCDKCNEESQEYEFITEVVLWDGSKELSDTVELCNKCIKEVSEFITKNIPSWDIKCTEDIASGDTE